MTIVEVRWRTRTKYWKTK